MTPRSSRNPTPRAKSRRLGLTVASLSVILSGLPAALNWDTAGLLAALPFIVAAICMTLMGARHARLLACVTILTALLPVLTSSREERLSDVITTLVISLATWSLAWVHQRQREQLQRRARARRRMVHRVKRRARRLAVTRSALQEQMERSQVAQQALLEHLPVHVIQKDIHGRFAFVSQSFGKLLGHPVEEIIGKTDYDFYDAQIADKFRRDDERVIGEGAIIDDVERTQLADGSYGYMQVRKAPLRDTSGGILGVQGIFWDVTEEFSGRVQLQRIESRAHALVQASLDAVLIVDATGHVLEANPASATILGYAQEYGDAHPPLGEIMRASASDLGLADVATANDPSSSSQSRLLTQLLKQATGRRIEVRLRRRDDTWFDAEMSAHPLAVENSSGWAIFIRDITRRKRSVLELQTAKDAAERATAAKSEFVANVSHELRTPLTGIVGLHELLERSELTDQQREYVGLAQKSSGNLLALIDALLDFSKIEAHKLELEHVSFDLCECIEAAAGALAARAQLRGLELVLDLPANLPQRILGDPDRVRQILLNLVGNAIKFTERGDIVVRVTTTDLPVPQAGAVGQRGTALLRPALRFDVVDAGIGIAEEHLSVIFEPFHQVDSSSTRRYGGTGLGLAICHELVKLMGGEFTVTSQPKRGSTFSFTLPLEVDPEAGGAASADQDSSTLAAAWQAGSTVTPAAIAAAPSLWTEMLQRDLTDRGFEVHRISIEDLLARRPSRLFLAGNNTLVFADYRELQTAAPASLPVCARTILCLPMAVPRPSQLPSCLRHGEVRWLARPISRRDLHRALRPTGEGTSIAVAPPADTQRLAVQANILLVEDSPINQTVLSGMLMQLGHHVTVASSGDEAVQHCRRIRYDVVLMDIQMPEIDGYEATRRIRAAEPTDAMPTQIIALTAHAMPRDREQALAAGMDDFLVKPIALERLRQAIEGVLGGAPQPPHDAAAEPSEPGVPESSGRRATMEPAPTPPPAAIVGLDSASGVQPAEATPTVWPEWSQVVECLGGNGQLAREVLVLLKREAPRLWRELAQAIRNQQARPARLAAHTLKSNLRSIGLRELSDIAAELERLSLAEQWLSAAAIMERSDQQISEISDWTDSLVRDAVHCASTDLNHQ
jgi:two-component system, sensor histidine kinase and response regulator